MSDLLSADWHWTGESRVTALPMERGRKGRVKITHSLIFLPRESGPKYFALGSGLYGYFGQ